MTLKLIFLGGGSLAFGLFLLYLFRTFRLKPDCPLCGNPHPDRKARSKVMKLIPCKAYQCSACGKRFYQLGWQSHQHPFRA